MDRKARRRYIERLFATADRLAKRMGSRFVVNRRKLRDFTRSLRTLAGDEQ